MTSEQCRHVFGTTPRPRGRLYTARATGNARKRFLRSRVNPGLVREDRRYSKRVGTRRVWKRHNYRRPRTDYVISEADRVGANRNTSTPFPRSICASISPLLSIVHRCYVALQISRGLEETFVQRSKHRTLSRLRWVAFENL